LTTKSTLKFNPRKYYISIVDKKNFAFIYIRKKKINITVLVPEDIIRDSIKHHQVESEVDSVQKFYGGPCATIIIEDTKFLDEVINVIKIPIK
jgi:predicted transport protein